MVCFKNKKWCPTFVDNSMEKKRSWFCWVKKLLTSEPKTESQKKSKKWRWVFGRFKYREQHPAIIAPPPPPQSTTKWNEAKEEQRKQALNVAMATAAAAEAAVTAARAAAEVVKLMATSKSFHHFIDKDQNRAAIKIQSAFRAYLARKALRALKGIVRIQAIARGRAVRRQTRTALNCLPANKKLGGHTECNQRIWDCSSRSKEDMEFVWLKKQEAAIKRERMMKYSHSQRERRIGYMLEESEILKQEIYVPAQVKPRNMRKYESREGSNSPSSFSRRSLCPTQHNNVFRDDNSLLNSPTYMAATQSAKAKARSISTPKQRVGFRDTCFEYDHSVRYRNELSFLASESITSNGRVVINT